MAISNAAKPPVRRLPSTVDVARKAGVSQTTVSFVLNPKTRAKVADATAQKVLDAIEELGYRPNILARSLVHGRTQTVGLVLPYLGSEYHAKIVYGIRDTLSQHGYQLLFMNAEPGSDAEATAVEFLLQQRVDAVICFVNAVTRNIAPDWLDSLWRAEVPAVVVDCPFYSDKVDTVVSDDISGMRSAVDHLYALGHRAICYIMDDSPAEYLPLRSRAFFERCAELGLASDQLIVYPTYASTPRGGWQRHEMMRVLKSDTPPTAFIGFNDFVFQDFLALGTESRPNIPRDVSLVGYCDSDFARWANLTSVSQNPSEIGVAAASRLLARLVDPALPVERIEVQTSLIVRGSTTPPRETQREPATN
ncbi:MAG: LacI family DNA-binding transcriptional regulator [Capsulimonadaceae bacterium]|nr:LacI family DNA-binding transcriptional regulator [Capsulimonadaceae bacterium]